MKAILCGNSTVGKTSLLNALSNTKEFGPTTPTLGAGCAKVYFQFHNKTRCMNLWDTAGQEAYRSLIKIYFRGVRVSILVFDVTSRPSFDELERWITDISESCDKEDCPILLVGNKIDLEDSRVISHEELLNKATELKRPFIEVSACTKKGIKEMMMLAFRMANGDSVPIDPSEEFLKSEFYAQDPDENDNIDIGANSKGKGCCK